MKRAPKPATPTSKKRPATAASKPPTKAKARSGAPKGKTALAPPKSAATVTKAKARIAKKPAAKGKGKVGATRAAGRGDGDREAIAERLAVAVPDAVCELRFEKPFDLLVATILAAQSTDKTVNAVMPSLLARYPTPEALADAPQEEVEEVVKRTGFFRNKAKAIRGAAKHVVTHHGGEVPRTLAELVAVPGVARKTANVVLGTAYRIGEGFIVDTHVTRVSQRLALTHETDPVRIERDLCAAFPASSWIDLGHRLVLHGRYTCLARKPDCKACPLNELCPSRLTLADGSWNTRAAAEAAKVSAALALP